MKAYPEYKRTGEAWIPAVPAQWGIMKIGLVFSERKEQVSDKDFAPLSVSKMGVVPQLSHAAKTNHGDNRKLVRKGDFVINSRSDRKGSSGVSELDGSVSLINIVLQPRMEINARYFHYLLRSNNFIEEFYRNGHGIVADLWTTRFLDMKKINVPVPSLEEQSQIVNYLDWQVSCINKLINTKKKQILLLEEQKLVIIDTLMENGNIATFGKFIKYIESGTSVNSEYGSASEDEFGILATSCVYGNYFRVSENKKVTPSEYSRLKCSVKAETIIISRMNTPSLVGACGYSKQDFPNIFLPDRLWQITTTEAMLPEYAWRYISSAKVQNWFASIATGSSNTMKNITKPQLRALQIPCPPIEEQKRIIQEIKSKNEKIDNCIKIIEDEIGKLVEYRERIISDAVTGQIDVRGVEIPEYEIVEEIVDFENNLTNDEIDMEE